MPQICTLKASGRGGGGRGSKQAAESSHAVRTALSAASNSLPK